MRELLHFLDNHAGAFQVLASVFIAGLTLCLVAVTGWYVRITNKSLSVSRRQLEEITRVDILLRMNAVPPGSAKQEAYVELVNLSGRGVLWEKLVITVKAVRTDKIGQPVIVPIGKVIPPYQLESAPCAKHFWDGYLTTSELDSPGLARVSLVAVIRGGGKEFKEPYESSQLVLSPDFICEL